MDKEVESLPLPSAPQRKLSANVTLQPPLSRRGRGPGLILLVPTFDEAQEELLDPKPIQKWAEEGYAVIEVKTGVDDAGDEQWNGADAIERAVKALAALAECSEKEKFGLIVYDQNSTPIASEVYNASPKLVAAISYGEHFTTNKPNLAHHTGDTIEGSNATKAYTYTNVASSSFPLPGHKDFSYSPAALAHSRCLSFLKPLIGGPYFDLEAIWEEHTYFEFADRSVAKTMATMVQEPYVNHIPTMTGGIGRERLSNFYRHHFIFGNPDDTKLELISRTVGIDRVIDEFIFSFTHVKEVDWLVPGIPPTGKHVQIPMTSVVNIRGDRLYHEHIAWDQATVLVQLGLMPEYLPWPYPGPDQNRRKMEFRVPAGGVETAKKLIDGHSVQSNEMFRYRLREVKE